MAKQRVTVTQTYQQVASGVAVVTVDRIGTGALYLDETPDDSTAYKSGSVLGEQFSQTESGVATYVRATGDGWEVIVDGEL